MQRGFRFGSVISLAAVALAIFSSAAGASAFPAHVPAPSHWWQADGNARDSVGHDNGRLAGAGFGPGPGGTGQAFSFSGHNDQVVFGKTGGNQGSGDFTFSFDIWTTATAEQAIWEKRIACDSNGTPFWGFRMQPGGQVSFELFSGPGNHDHAVTSTVSINDGAWHQVTVTRHGHTLSLYVDGTLDATATSATTVKVTNDARMRAGVSACDGADGTVAFTGELGQLMIYRSALTPAQIHGLSSGYFSLTTNTWEW